MITNNDEIFKKKYIDHRPDNKLSVLMIDSSTVHNNT